jgi:site-specific recombinase
LTARPATHPDRLAAGQPRPATAPADTADAASAADSLIDLADPSAPRPERHLWLMQALDWLRAPEPEATRSGPADTPAPVRRLRRLLDALEARPEAAARVRALLRAVLTGGDGATLLADFGFAPRAGFLGELGDRLRHRLLPATPDTADLGRLFQMVFDAPGDAGWIAAIDPATLQRLDALLMDATVRRHWHDARLDSVQLLASQVRAVGMSALLRGRIDPARVADRPFHRLVLAAAHLAEADAAGDQPGLQRQVAHLREVLRACRAAAASVREHLDEHGISVEVIFQIEQLRARTERIDALLALHDAAGDPRGWPRLVAQLAEGAQARRGVRALFAHHHAMLARKVAERHADTGEHYITRTRAEWLEMLRRACGGGLVIAGTTFLKFAIGALGLAAFWGGFWAGINYAASFVLVQLLHWTVATKQPAMTAPAMAARLDGLHGSDAGADDFADEVAHLIRTQIVGIIGNVVVVMPAVLAVQLAAWALQGAPLVGAETARHALDKLVLPGPTLAYAAFTGVLLFLSSLIAGWVENGFVFNRLDSAIAWNPRITRALGPARAQRWALWWRQNISGLAANVSLGLLLGLVPVLAAFFGLPVEVRHVTLSAGQVAAALGALGMEALREPVFWWALAAVPLTGLLNVAVSFALAFRLALRARGVQVTDRGRLHAALWRRLREAPGSFVRPQG